MNEKGAVAQSGERFGGIEEVRGSSPRSSTSLEGSIGALIEGMRKRAEIREKIDRGDGKVDRIGAQLTEAADVLERLWKASSRVVAIAKDGEPDREHADLVRIYKILECALDEDKELREEQEAWMRASAEAFWRVDEELGHRCWATVAAERMAKAIHGLVFRRKIDARSEAADAALDWRDPVGKDRESPKVSDETAEEDHWNEDGLTGLAIELADMVSDMLWGGERGWECATKEQFEHLKREARKRMKV